MKDSNAGTMWGEHAEQRGGAETNVCDGKSLVAGEPCLPACAMVNIGADRIVVEGQEKIFHLW